MMPLSYDSRMKIIPTNKTLIYVNHTEEVSYDLM